MATGLNEEQVREALRPFLGSALVEQTPLCAGCAEVLRRYAPYRDTLAELAGRVERYLFDALYTALGDAMTVRLDSGETRRIRMRELPDLADECMGVLFDDMQVYSVTYGILKDYSMQSGSLSAMRVLYQRFGAFQPREEKELIARVVRDRYPEARWRGWID